MNYHVFLSFRGEDTRTNFTDHLYSALLRKGIITFRDEEEVEKGEVISEKLIKAIEQSLFCVVIFSQHYASSSWCLDELVKIMGSKQSLKETVFDDVDESVKIMGSREELAETVKNMAIKKKLAREELAKTVFPVFYGVDPSDIRRQKGNFETAFKKHGAVFPNDKVQRWRQALTWVANLSGFDARNRHEAHIVEDIAKFIWNKLCDKLPSSVDHLVGDIQSEVEKIISLLEIGLDDKFFIGIWGMGGIGKTTLARVVYDSIRSKFDNSCFLENVREDSDRVGSVGLQKKLLFCLGLREPEINDSFHGREVIRHFLCPKKVLIVLDDVSHRSQLDNLARNKEWFGPGSKIIITTRDVHLLTQYKQFQEYEVEKLRPDESLKLLCQKAFKKDEPDPGYLDLSRQVVEYACGLPLALEVLGSFLCRRKQSEWRGALEKLRQNLHHDIFNQLRISYDGLEDEEYRKMFLDIACFFNREDKFKVINILKICGLHPSIGIQVLIEKSLLAVEKTNLFRWEIAEDHRDNVQDILKKLRRDIFLPTYSYDLLPTFAPKEYLYMHDLLQEMGRNVVLQESPGDAGQRSRLWSLEDIDLVLKEDKGAENVQSICLDIQEEFQAKWHPDCFSKMQNLRLLNLSKVHLLHDLNSLPSALKFLNWDHYALESLPPFDQLYELQCLQLCNSKIRKLWNGAPSLAKLRLIDLSYSDCLIETTNFSATPNLEELVLNHCSSLVQIHESVGQLKKLVKLHLTYCINLVTLPSYLDTDNLEEFILAGCIYLKKLPEFGRNMTSLYILDVGSTRINEIPLSIINLINLKHLDVCRCYMLKSLPQLPSNLIISGSFCPMLSLTRALEHICASHILKGPIHVFYDYLLDQFMWKSGNPWWFEEQEHRRSKSNSGEVVTIQVDIPHENALYSGKCYWEISICVAFGGSSTSKSFSINWKFQDYCHPYPNDNKIHEETQLGRYRLRCSGVYVGVYPIDKEHCRPHPKGVGSQVYLTLCFPTINIRGWD